MQGKLKFFSPSLPSLTINNLFIKLHLNFVYFFFNLKLKAFAKDCAKNIEETEKSRGRQFIVHFVLEICFFVPYRGFSSISSINP